LRKKTSRRGYNAQLNTKEGIPVKRTLLMTLVLFLGGVIASSSAAASGYQAVAFSAPHLGGMTTHFDLILPVGYGQSARRYPVLYLLHGYTGNYTDWVTHCHLTDYAKAYQEIIVMPDGENSWYVNNYTQPQLQWEDYIIMDLIPYVDAHYRTIATRQGRAIAGLSMGGYGAMMLGLKHPQLFIAIASLSGALASAEPRFEEETTEAGIKQALASDFGPLDNPDRPKDDPFWLVQTITPAACPHLFLAIGSSDPLVQENRRFVRLLSSLGFRYRYYEVPGKHEWAVWCEQIQNVLRLQAPILGAEVPLTSQ
jgi:putative tributyrin esterase